MTRGFPGVEVGWEAGDLGEEKGSFYTKGMMNHLAFFQRWYTLRLIGSERKHNTVKRAASLLLNDEPGVALPSAKV